MSPDDPRNEAIKARAVEILCNHLHWICRPCPSLRELCERKNGWRLHNAVGVALCRARAARDSAVVDIEGRFGPLRVRAKRCDHFNIGNFERAEREIIKTLKAGNREAR